MFIGVAAAMVLVIGGGVAAYLVIKQYAGSTVQTDLRDRHLSGGGLRPDLHDVLDAVPQPDHVRRPPAPIGGGAQRQGRFGLGLLAFQAVGREGVETMVFTLAIVFASSNQAATAATVTDCCSVPSLGLARGPRASPSSSSSSAAASTSASSSGSSASC